jgi:hypothetical protein
MVNSCVAGHGKQLRVIRSRYDWTMNLIGAHSKFHADKTQVKIFPETSTRGQAQIDTTTTLA